MKCSHHDSHSISATSWDEFIYNSPQGSPFLLHEWMSCVFMNWQYLEVGDGNRILARMPLSPARKWFWHYAFQPLFCQHWGVVFAKDLSPTEMQACIALLRPELEKRFSLITFYFSPYYPDTAFFQGKEWQITPRITHLSVLGSSPEQSFSPSAVRQYKKAEKAGYRILEEWSIKSVELILKKNPGIMNPKQLDLFLKLYALVQEKQLGFSLMAHSPLGEIVAMGIFVTYQERVYYLAGAVLPEQRNSGVMTQLMRTAMNRAYKQGKTILDFEGSMNPGIAKFFKGLGGQEKNYICISYNRMPFSKLWKK